ncbi:hypothetical protein TIFTF001_028286 [Ficus carica]|uniref:Uncharacterized protein n=1 Tax=Ficus carica TaxID=3494 RepID=A0AA88DPR6_FICCA|nr:hypothetical protein TIFTF001_028286 [Ficus carica]
MTRNDGEARDPAWGEARRRGEQLRRVEVKILDLDSPTQSRPHGGGGQLRWCRERSPTARGGGGDWNCDEDHGEQRVEGIAMARSRFLSYATATISGDFTTCLWGSRAAPTLLAPRPPHTFDAVDRDLCSLDGIASRARSPSPREPRRTPDPSHPLSLFHAASVADPFSASTRSRCHRKLALVSPVVGGG